MSKIHPGYSIFDAVVNNDAIFIESYLGPLDIIDPLSAKTPLYIAAQRGHAAAITELLKKGASIAVNNGLIGTPLHIAAYLGHTHVVRAILEHEPSFVNLLNDKGETPAYSAVFNDNPRHHYKAIEVIKVLAQYHADFTIPSVVGRDSPLERAGRHGHIDVVKFLRGDAGPLSDETREMTTVFSLSLEEVTDEKAPNASPAIKQAHFLTPIRTTASTTINRSTHSTVASPLAVIPEDKELSFEDSTLPTNVPVVEVVGGDSLSFMGCWCW